MKVYYNIFKLDIECLSPVHVRKLTFFYFLSPRKIPRCQDLIKDHWPYKFPSRNRSYKKQFFLRLYMIPNYR